jgi:hypothetical protein
MNLGTLVLTATTHEAIHDPGSTLIAASLLSECRSLVGTFWPPEDIYSPLPLVFDVTNHE